MKTTIGKLFDVSYGQTEYENKSLLDEEGNNMIISSKGEDNGVHGFYNVSDGYKAPVISVPRTGTIGQAFVQLTDCSIDSNCLVLIPKQKLDTEQLFQVAYQIRLIKWKYKYGRQITPARLQAQEVILAELDINYDALVEKILPKEKKKIKMKKVSAVYVFKLKDLFKVERGKGSYLEKLDSGSTPVISTKASNCGVVGFYDIEPIFEKNQITVGRIMCNPNVQLNAFSTVPDDMFVLKPLNEVDKEFLFYVSAIVKADKWRFNYYRKANKEKLEKTNVPLPMNGNAIDYAYIREFVSNRYGFEELDI